jgi:hypothetical protein
MEIDHESSLREAPLRRDPTREDSFDELAKGMASGAISRRKALKLVGAAVFGGALVSLFPGVAEARHRRHRCKPGQRGCAIGVCKCPKGSRCVGAGSGGHCK